MSMAGWWCQDGPEMSQTQLSGLFAFEVILPPVLSLLSRMTAFCPVHHLGFLAILQLPTLKKWPLKAPAIAAIVSAESGAPQRGLGQCILTGYFRGRQLNVDFNNGGAQSSFYPAHIAFFSHQLLSALLFFSFGFYWSVFSFFLLNVHIQEGRKGVFFKKKTHQSALD